MLEAFKASEQKIEATFISRKKRMKQRWQLSTVSQQGFFQGYFFLSQT
jgi:hypothetical protein